MQKCAPEATLLYYRQRLAEAFDKARQTDARPGGHAKWVKSPRGPATVNG
jgi:hypothetical protein